LWLAAILPWFWMDLGKTYGTVALVAAMAAVGLVVCAHWLLVPTVVLVILAAEALGVFGVRSGDDLPFVQFGGVRLTVRDALLILCLTIAIWQLVRRGERPVYTVPLLVVVGAISVAFLLGVVLDADVKPALNGLRPLFAYALYPIIVAAVNSPRKLKLLIASIFVVALVAVVVQLMEAAHGSPFPFLAPPLIGNAQAAAGLSVGGRGVPYIWNRAIWDLFVALLLAVGCVVEGRALWTHTPIVVACAVGFIIMLARSWYIFVAAGVVAVLLVQVGWRQRLRSLGLLGMGMVVIAAVTTVVGGLVSASYGGSLLGVWQTRALTLLSFQGDSSYVQRVSELQLQWQAVLGSPLLGYGLSSEGQQLILLGNLDTGAVNTVLSFGFIGTASFLLLSMYAIVAATRLARGLDRSWQRGYALGVVGIWVGVLVGYGFNYDMFTYSHGPWLVVLALGLGDRLERLAVKQ
jgi:hypothetical protein